MLNAKIFEIFDVNTLNVQVEEQVQLLCVCVCLSLSLNEKVPRKDLNENTRMHANERKSRECNAGFKIMGRTRR